jgi:tetraacyldisaccharide 4'-kinase
MTGSPHRPDILLVSNGFGEAAIATYLARAIRARSPDARIEHLPLVGLAQPGQWPPTVGPQQQMPSGGLVAYWNLRNLSRDLGAGLGGLTLRQYRFLREQTGRDVVIAVGDIFCLGMCLAAARRPTIFVATAKSDLVAPHSGLESAIARKAAAAFARDEPTAASLRASGVRAQYAGNIMMDGLERAGVDLGVQPGELVLAVLPGSRADAADAVGDHIERLAAIARLVERDGRVVHALVSLAPSVAVDAVASAIVKQGISCGPVHSGPGVVMHGSRGNLRISVVKGAFGDLIAASNLVLGQAGTANEQAAGAGKPVVAATQPGEAPTAVGWYRMRQKKLLGDALFIVPGEPETFAREVIALARDPARMAHMTAVGRARMGAQGGADAVAARALDLAARAGTR